MTTMARSMAADRQAWHWSSIGELTSLSTSGRQIPQDTCLLQQDHTPDPSQTVPPTGEPRIQIYEPMGAVLT